MKTDLVLTLKTGEKEDLTMRKDIHGDVLFILGSMRFSVNPDELKLGLATLNKFYKGKKTEDNVGNTTSIIPDLMTIGFGEE